MLPDGLIALNGVPGSGKTLDAVTIALEHYKKENRKYKYYIALIKYKINNYIKRHYKIVKIINIVNKVRSNILYKIVALILKIYIYLFMLLCLFQDFNIFLKILIVLFFLKKNKIKNIFKNADYDYYTLFKDNRINNVYSSFPILLDKKRDIWSHMVDIFDLSGEMSFLPNCLIIIDEIQLFIDSDEYKDKSGVIGRIGKFLQAHRHFGVKQIIFTSQSPSRIFKKARNIIVGYLKQSKIINLPLGISIMRGVLYYDFDNYGKYIPRNREERKRLSFEYKKVIKIFNRNKSYTSYDSRYLSLYNYNKPLSSKGYWKDFKVEYYLLEDLFEGIKGDKKSF